MGGTSKVFAAVSWVARQTNAATGEASDPWAIGQSGAGSTTAADLLRNFRWVSIVDEVILIFTVIGSFSILASMFWLEYKGRPATTRMRIVQSLVLSDLILGLVGIVGTSLVLSGKPLEAGTGACSGLGYCLVVVLWTEHLWTLILAIATYMILIYPLHPATLWLERRWYYLWLLVWVIAAAMGIIGYFVFGYFPNGGICYYGQNSGLYGELIQFIPRATVMLLITILYARLFVFLRRPDRIRASFSDSSNGEMYESKPQSRAHYIFRSRNLAALLSRGRAGSKGTDSSDKGPLHPPNEKSVRIEVPSARSKATPAGLRSTGESSLGAPTRPYHLPTPPSTPDEPAPWEQVQLPIFHVDGERFGGRSAGGGSNELRKETSSIWSGWKGMGKNDRERGRTRGGEHRPSVTSSSSPPPTARSNFGSVSTASRDPPGSPKSATFASGAFPPTAEDDFEPPSLHGDIDPDRTPTQTRYNAGDVWQTAPADRQGSVSSSLGERVERFRKPSAVSAFEYRVTEEPEGPDTASNSRRGSGAIQNDVGRLAVTPNGSQIEEEKAGYPFPGTAATSSQSTSRPRQHQRSATGDEEDRDGEEEGDDDWDLMRMLQASAPAADPSRSHVEDQVEFVEESMASYLNRKTALLMLWFPLGYVLLFSVSLVRIIYDFAGSPPIELRALSRWFIFSQGVLDALIYGLVEWHTKRVVRKRVRKGTFNTPSGSRNAGGSNAGTGSALGALRAIGQGSRGLFSSRGSVQAGVNAPTRSGGGIPVSDRGGLGNSQTRSRMSNRTPTTSFIPAIPEGHSLDREIGEESEGDGDLQVTPRRSGTGSGSGYEVEEDSTRKGSTASEMGTVLEVVPGGTEEDGRKRERWKE